MKTLVVCKSDPSISNKEIEANKTISNEGFDIIYSWKNNLIKKDLEKIDLIISIGGDGTALSASHFIEDKPLLAVNLSPETSEGALTTITLNNLKEKLEKIKENKFQTEKLERIEISINNQIIDFLALNDVFIGHEKSYLISKYKIKFKEINEKQISSGLIFSTGTGSTAWYRSAGGIPFSPQSKFIQMLTREPYKGKLTHFQNFNLQINENEEIEITPLVPSIIAIDSIREIHVKENDKIKIKISKNPLIRIK